MDFEDAVEELCSELADLIVARQRKYGPTNIQRHLLPGIAVRLGDKLARLDNFIGGDGAESEDESIRDTLLDIAGYGIIGLMIADGVWTRTECPKLRSS